MIEIDVWCGECGRHIEDVKHESGKVELKVMTNCGKCENCKKKEND